MWDIRGTLFFSDGKLDRQNHKTKGIQPGNPNKEEESNLSLLLNTQLHSDDDKGPVRHSVPVLSSLKFTFSTICTIIFSPDQT